MITNFKIYEKLTNSKYQKGDYVLLLEDDVHARWRVKLEVYIYDLFYNEREKEFNYHVEGELLDNNEITTFWIRDDEIGRKMTPDEIENYKIRKSAIKYNL